MSLPAIRALRERYGNSHIAVLARPWVADLYQRETAINAVIPYTVPRGWAGWKARRDVAARLSAEHFDAAILLPNSFDSALVAWMARIPERIGYARDGRSLLLTAAVRPPGPGDIPRHERFYYLELLRRAGILSGLPPVRFVCLEGVEAARAAGLTRLGEAGLTPPVIGASPGAAYGGAKRWLPERFAECATRVARECGASVALFGSAGERELCDRVAAAVGVPVMNFAGRTTLAEFIELAATCRLFLTNDSGAMHVASALGIPTVAVFGATDDTTTGPAGPLARVVREQVECSPCLLRECPIDHRCMTRVTVDRVTGIALQLLRESA